jgi:sugar O-acyltransferase (sialic acid O-acetyltransferase NeuD family)
MKQAIGLGAGGHAKVIIEILRLRGEFEVIGLLDANPRLHGTAVLGVPVLGGDSQMSELLTRELRHAFVGLGSTSDNGPRTVLYEMAKANGFEVIAAIDPRASISPSAIIGAGAIIMPGAIVNAGARIGENVIVNSGAIIEHDCTIGNHVHIATGARLGGGVTVLDGAHVGLGAGIRQGARIGRNAVVGAGAVVIHDVADGATVAGVPARPLASNQSSE